MGEMCKGLLCSIFEYDTPKIVHIKNKAVGILCRLVQLVILGYIIGYVIIWNKGYQAFGDIESAVVTKVKGIVFPNFTDSEFNPEIRNSSDLYRRVWDVADYVVPSSENSAFYITTNILITGNQTQGSCPEDYEMKGALCTNDSDCEQGSGLPTGNGVFTGECVESDVNSTVSVCQILGWCPVERDVDALVNGTAVLSAAKNFTVLIKNFVDFPKFGIKRRNIPEVANSSYLKNCNYNAKTDPLCPIFVIGDIVDDFEDMAVKGGVIAITIKWDCNFDFEESYCIPTYSFSRLDEKHAPLSPGFNFRYAHYYSDTKRTLFKTYGIKFVIQAQGRGGKFNVVPLFLNLGSGLGLLAISTVICDIVVLYVVKKRHLYKAVKFQTDTDEEKGSVFSVTWGGTDGHHKLWNVVAQTRHHKLVIAVMCNVCNCKKCN